MKKIDKIRRSRKAWRREARASLNEANRLMLELKKSRLAAENAHEKEMIEFRRAETLKERLDVVIQNADRLRERIDTYQNSREAAIRLLWDHRDHPDSEPGDPMAKVVEFEPHVASEAQEGCACGYTCEHGPHESELPERAARCCGDDRPHLAHTGPNCECVGVEPDPKKLEFGTINLLAEPVTLKSGETLTIRSKVNLTDGGALSVEPHSVSFEISPTSTETIVSSVIYDSADAGVWPEDDDEPESEPERLQLEAFANLANLKGPIKISLHTGDIPTVTAKSFWSKSVGGERLEATEEESFISETQEEKETRRVQQEGRGFDKNLFSIRTGLTQESPPSGFTDGELADLRAQLQGVGTVERDTPCPREDAHQAHTWQHAGTYDDDSIYQCRGQWDRYSYCSSTVNHEWHVWRDEVDGQRYKCDGDVEKEPEW